MSPSLKEPTSTMWKVGAMMTSMMSSMEILRLTGILININKHNYGNKRNNLQNPPKPRGDV